MRIYHTDRGTSGYLHGGSIYRVPTYRTAPSLFSMAKIEIYFPQARPILLSNFSSSPSFNDTIDSHIHSNSFANVPVQRVCYSSLIVTSAFKSFRFWNFHVLWTFYVRKFLLFYFMCRRLLECSLDFSYTL